VDVLPFIRTLDGSGNNVAHPTWGQAGTAYPRVGPANYADGVSSMQGGPSPRRISNRVLNDVGQNPSARTTARNGAGSGDTIDHDIGLRDETPGETSIPFDANDPLGLWNDPGRWPQPHFGRARMGTSAANPRQQINTISSVIDASQI
jgi:hypothetical protein